MKILSVSNYYPPKYPQKNNHQSTDYNNSNTTFNGWNVKVLELPEDSLQTVAKHFYKSTEEELREVTTETFIGIKRKNRSLAAYYKLKSAVDKAKLDVESIQSMIRMVESKPKKDPTDIHSLSMLKSQLKEYEDAFESRQDKYYTYPANGSIGSDDLDYQIQLSKSDGSWYDY